jgi:type IV pilus assembly protein PilO
VKNLSLNAKLWLFAFACLVACAYLGYIFYTSDYKDYSQAVVKLDADVKRKKDMLRQVLAQKHRIKELEVEIELANQEFVKLKEMFPDEEAIPRRLIDLTSVTRKSSVLPTKFLPLPSEEKDFYQENHYSISVSAGYHALGMLFGEIANFKYPTSINKLQIERTPELYKEVDEAEDHGETPRTVLVNFQFTTFTSKK